MAHPIAQSHDGRSSIGIIPIVEPSVRVSDSFAAVWPLGGGRGGVLGSRLR